MPNKYRHDEIDKMEVLWKGKNMCHLLFADEQMLIQYDEKNITYLF